MTSPSRNSMASCRITTVRSDACDWFPALRCTPKPLFHVALPMMVIGAGAPATATTISPCAVKRTPPPVISRTGTSLGLPTNALARWEERESAAPEPVTPISAAHRPSSWKVVSRPGRVASNAVVAMMDESGPHRLSDSGESDNCNAKIRSCWSDSPESDQQEAVPATTRSRAGVNRTASPGCNSAGGSACSSHIVFSV